MKPEIKKKLSLLLFEDDDVDAMGFERAMRRVPLDLTLYRAKDGAEGLQMLRDGAVDAQFLILMDLNMPRMSGLEVMKEIRKDPKLRKSVIFVLTTSQDDEDIAHAYSLNAAGYMVKTHLDNGSEGLFSFLSQYCELVEMCR